MIVSPRRNARFWFYAPESRVFRLWNHINQNPIGTTTSNIIHDTPLITKTPRPSKGRVPSYIYVIYIYVYINTIYFRWFIYCRRWYLFWPFLWTIHQPYSRLNISDLARLGLERRLADAETEERHGTRHSERLPSHGSEEHLEGAAGRWGDGMIYRDVQ